MRINTDEKNNFTYTYQLEKGISTVKGGVKVLTDLAYPKEIINQMKKVLFIAALFTLASCSNSTTTSSKDSACTDSTCMDTCNIDSLIDSTNAHVDTLNALISESKK